MLVVNGRYRTRPITGVERYAHELTRRIRSDVRFEMPSSHEPGWRGHLWEQFYLPKRVRKDEWLFSPANMGPLAIKKQILTIHDLSPLEHPEWFSSGFSLWYRLLWPLLARRVRGILTVSEFSRQRIIACLGIPAEKVRAMSNGVDREMFHPASPAKIEILRKKYALNQDFLLFVGSLQPRKNLAHLSAAWERVRDNFSQLDLVVAGTTGAQFHSANFEYPSIRFLGYLPDSELPTLYSAAIGLVHPSLYEGSGLTLLEAMACGCPLAASNSTAFPEIVGDAGVAFNPLDVENIAETVQLLLANAELRQSLKQKGLKRVEYFTWERSCDEFHESLQHFKLW